MSGVLTKRYTPVHDLYDDYESPKSIQKTKEMWQRLINKQKEEERSVKCQES